MIELLSERRHGTATPFAMVTARLLPAVACGAAVGFERDRRNRPAGLRTHILVCLAAVVLAVLAPEMDNLPIFDEVAVLFFRSAASKLSPLVDSSPSASSSSRGRTHRPTKGPGPWLSVAIGVAARQGLRQIAPFATLITLLALGLLHVPTYRLDPDEDED